MQPPIDRRSFVKGISFAGIAAVVGVGRARADDSPVAATAPAPVERHRYVIVGVGGRSSLYQGAIEGDYKDHALLVGICDTNAGRMELSRSKSVAAGCQPPVAVAPDGFEEMLAETKAQTVIVTSMCSTHDEYIVRALDAGCDAITEKPMATTAEKVQRVIDAVKRTGRTCRVDFNYRYSPPRTQVKDILMSGEIGDIRSVDFHWMLNTSHGADYFRRWHHLKKNSGGLMVHKATHHFDLVNWWLGAMPVSVFATGKREYYTPAMAKRMGLKGAHDRCHTCDEKDRCTFFMDLAADKNLKALYLDQEKYDNYHRDQCVFREDHTIEDTMNVLVRYDNNITMAYSLNAFNAWEGYHIVFNGTKGRLEHTSVEQVGKGDIKPGITTRIIPLRGGAKTIEPWTGKGGHGGGDTVMLDDIFLPDKNPDKYQRASNHFGGAASALVGIAANTCFETKQPVEIASLITGLEMPDMAPMPSRDGPVPMPGGNA